MDTNFRRWTISQKFVILIFLIFFILVFKDKYFYIKQLGFRVTISVLVSIVMMIFNTLNVFGLLANIPLKQYVIFNLVPIGVVLFEIASLWYLSRNLPITVYYLYYLRLIGILLMSAITNLIFHVNNEIITIDYTERVKTEKFDTDIYRNER